MDIAKNITYILIVLSIVVIIISNIELWYCKRKSKFALDLPIENVTIQNGVFGFEYPVYIYNSSKTHRKDLKLLPSYNDNIYDKYEIPVHIGSKIMTPIKDAFKALTNLPHTRMPINTLYTTLNKSDTFLSTINPLIAPDKSKYRVLISKFDIDNIEIFIDDKIYFIK